MVINFFQVLSVIKLCQILSQFHHKVWYFQTKNRDPSGKPTRFPQSSIKLCFLKLNWCFLLLNIREWDQKTEAYWEVYENAAKIKWNKIILIHGFNIGEEFIIAVPKYDCREDKIGERHFLKCL